jgi:hypothetical protein
LSQDKQANSAVEDKMKYPGRVIKTGEQDPKIVKVLKVRLN